MAVLPRFAARPVVDLSNSGRIFNQPPVLMLPGWPGPVAPLVHREAGGPALPKRHVKAALRMCFRM